MKHTLTAICLILCFVSKAQKMDTLTDKHRIVRIGDFLVVDTDIYVSSVKFDSLLDLVSGRVFDTTNDMILQRYGPSHVSGGFILSDKNMKTIDSAESGKYYLYNRKSVPWGYYADMVLSGPNEIIYSVFFDRKMILRVCAYGNNLHLDPWSDDLFFRKPPHEK